MADFPPLLGDCTRALTFGQTFPTTVGTSVPAGASANQKGSWVPIVPAASLTFDPQALIVYINTPFAPSKCLVDVGIGSTAVPLVENLLIQDVVANTFSAFCLPLATPAATTISLRCQTNSASLGVHGMITVISQGFIPPANGSRAQTMGVTTTVEPPGTSADSNGTAVDPGAIINTKGSWVSLGTLNFPCSYLMFALGNRSTTSRSTCQWRLDIGIQTSPEIVILPDLLVASNSGSDYTTMPAVIGPVPMTLPFGTTLYARSQCSIRETPQRTFEIAAYAFG